MKKILLSTFVFITFLSTSCTDRIEKADNIKIESTKLVLTPEEYTSIAYSDPKELSENEITNIIYDFKRVSSEFRGKLDPRSHEVSKISIRKKYYITNNNDTIQYNTSRSINPSTINIPIFEIELDKKDFVIVCGDERAAKVLFYADNFDFSNEISTDMKYLMEIAKQNVLTDIELIEKIKTEKRSSTLNKVSKELNIPKEQITDDVIKRRTTTTDDISTRGYNPIGGYDISQIPSRIVSMVYPMANIGWHQEEPYNNQMPEGILWDGMSAYEGRHPVGCANIAIATLFSILKPEMVGETSTGRQILIDWDYITSKSTLNESSPKQMTEMVGSLLRGIYNHTNSKPQIVEHDTYDEDNNPIKVKTVIQTSTTIENMLSYISTKATFTGGITTTTQFDPEIIKQSLLDLKPVLLFGNGHFLDKNDQPINEEPYNETPGHGWLIDGYCMTKKSGQVQNDLYWSVNMGWGKNSSNVYFKTQNNIKFCDVIFYFDKKANIAYYTQEQNMIYNIIKK